MTGLSQQQLWAGGHRSWWPRPSVPSWSGQRRRASTRRAKGELPAQAVSQTLSPCSATAHVGRSCTADSYWEQEQKLPSRNAPPSHRSLCSWSRRCQTRSFACHCPRELFSSRNRSSGFPPQKPQPTLVWLFNRKHQSVEV